MSLVFVLLLGVASSPTAPAPTQPTAARAPAESLTLAQAPAALRAAVARKLESHRGRPALHASYTKSSVKLTGPGWSASVGLGQVGRAHTRKRVSGPIEHVSTGVRYTTAGITEAFTAVAGGIEQSFEVSQRPAGSGPLVIEVPVHGLRVSGSGSSLVLRSLTGSKVGAYTGLRVTDAAGRKVPAEMRAEAGGRTIAIRIGDRGARYPLNVDPTWAYVAELTGIEDEAGSGAFGLGVALSADGTTALVGGPQDNGGVGAAWVFARSGSSWSQQGPKLISTHETGSAFFGESVALSADGNTALVGGPNDSSGDGAAWVFTRSATGSWNERAQLSGGDSGAGFGYSVALSADGTTALVGGQDDNSFAGAAWVFTGSGATWNESSKLAPSDEVGSGDFGISVALSADGKTALIGGPYDGDFGAAWVYKQGGTGWTEDQKLTGTNEIGNAFFGRSVALSADGSTALVGGPADANQLGAAWAFTDSGGAWTQLAQKLIPETGTSDQNFGASLALTGDGGAALIGDTTSLDDAGSAYLFTMSDAQWKQVGAPMTGIGENGTGAFGIGVALASDGKSALVGGKGDNNDVGAAWSFALTLKDPPGAPTSVAATPGDGQATVSFTPPSYDGGTPITSYTVTATPGGAQATGTASPVVVAGLTDGTSYTFTVTATNSAGTGAPSGASAAVTPTQSAAYTCSGTQQTLIDNWDGGGVSDGGVPPTFSTGGHAYCVTYTAHYHWHGGLGDAGPGTIGLARVGGPSGAFPAALDFPAQTSSGQGGALNVNWFANVPQSPPQLIDGTYTCTDSRPATWSWDDAAHDGFCRVYGVPAVRTQTTVPDAPTGVSAVAGDGAATVSFTPPASDGGAAITTYTVTASPGGAHAVGTSSPITVTGLTDGTAYTFTVTATNSVGTGAASAASASVTPAGIATPWTGGLTGTTTGTATVVSDGTSGPAELQWHNNAFVGSWIFQTTANFSGTVHLPWTFSGFFGWFEVTANLSAFVTHNGITTSTTLVNVGPTDCCSPPSGGFTYTGTATLTVAPGDTYGFTIGGTDFTASPVKSGTLTIGPTLTTTATTDVALGGTIADQATLAGGASGAQGSITFNAYSDSSCTTLVHTDVVPVTSGDGTYAAPGFAPTASGTYYWTASYSGDPSTHTLGAVEGCGSPNEASTVSTPPVKAYLFAAAPNGSGGTTIVGYLVGTPNTSVTLSFKVMSAGCDSAATPGGTTVASTGSTGQAYFTGTATGDVGGVLAAVTAGAVGPDSNCVPIVADNTSWPKAARIDVSSGSGSADGYVDSPGVARWYKFSVSPDTTAAITLSNLPADYRIAVFRDIGQAYDNLVNQQNDLTQRSAEAAADQFTPSAFLPSAFLPSAFLPSAFLPSAFLPSAFLPSAFLPSAFLPSAFLPSAFLPSAFLPSAFLPSAFLPSAFLPSAFLPSAFLPSAFTSAQSQSILALSSQPGTGDKSVSVDTWLDTGDYYVRVTGAGSAGDATHPFDLSVSESGGGYCTGVAPIGTAPGAAPAGGYNTVILTDPGRMTGSPDAMAALQTKLAALAASPKVNGAIVDLGADSRVAALNAQADAHTGCPYAKNLVAGAIKDVVASYRQANPIKYVVVVGDDSVVPFFRYPDTSSLGNETGYVPPVADTSPSQAALRGGYFLSQDAYGAGTDLQLQVGDVPVPDLPVGRLVDTPGEIGGMIDAFLGTTDGVVPGPSSSLVTGYDFLNRDAQAVKQELDAGTGGRQSDTLIAPDGISPLDAQSWTGADLQQAVLSKRHDLIFLAGHFSANDALAADFTTDMLASSLASSQVDLTNSIVFTPGCHSGYDLVPGDIVRGVTEPESWPEAFAQKQATLIAGTGYQYGDTDFIRYSEQLYLDFAHDLRVGSGPVAVGSALVAAKQNYLSGTPQLDGLNEKAMLESTLYGLPMLSVDMPDGRVTPRTTGSIVGSTTAATTDPGQRLGLRTADVTIPETLTPHTVTLNTVDANGSSTGTVDTTYFSGPNDQTVGNPYQPVLPLDTQDVSFPNTVLRGVGFRGGTYTDSQGVPLTGAPATEIRAPHSPFVSTSFFPERLWNVNYFGALTDPSGGSTQLMLTPAQVRTTPDGSGAATLRQFQSLSLRLFYSDNTQTYDAGTDNASTPSLSDAPTVGGVGARIDGGSVDFAAHAVGNPAAGIQETWVTYTFGDGTWTSLDLGQDSTDSTLWEGSLPLNGRDASELVFMVQSANGVGLVTLDDNAGAYYSVATVAAKQAAVQLPSTLTLAAPPASGAYGSTLPLSASLVDANGPVAGQEVDFSVGSQTVAGITDAHGQASVALPLVLAPGAYTAVASFAGSAADASSNDSAPISVDAAATTLTISQPDTVGGGADLTASLAAGGAPLQQRAVTLVLNGPDGTFTKTAQTDFLGRAQFAFTSLAGGDYTATAYFDGTIPFPGGAQTITDPDYEPAKDTFTPVVPDIVPPTIVGSASPAPNAAGWNRTNVDVAFSCADSGSGIFSCPAKVTLAQDGKDQSVSGTAVDKAGNQASATVGGINIDETPPTLTGKATTDPNANGWYKGDVTIHWTCSDALSGIAGSCPPDDTITGEGKSLTANASVEDVAGNTTAATSVPVKIDRNAPLTTSDAGSGWSTTGVTVTLTATDNLSGVDQTYYQVDGGATQTGTTIAITTDGAHTIAYWSVDKAGNSEARRTAQVLVDQQAPTITDSLSPLPNPSGWNQTTVTVTFTCAAGVSGLASCTSPQTLANEGKDMKVAGTAKSVAGLSATDTAHVSIDETKPTISADTDRAPNANGWYNAAVKVSFTCNDALSGILSCPPARTVNEGGAQYVTGTATDYAGNSSRFQLGPINVDETPPSVAVTGVANHGVYLVGAVPTPGCSTSDGLSGVATNAALSVSGGPTGTITATCSGATDKAGNAAAAVSATYSVAKPLGAGATSCNGFYGGSGGSVTVSAGAICTLVPGTHVSGNVQVQKGGALDAESITVGGNLQATNAAWLVVKGGSVAGDLQAQGLTTAPPGSDNALCNASVGGNVEVHNGGSGAPADVGNLGSCAGAGGLHVTGNLEVHNNAATVLVGGNSAGGNVDVHNNGGGGTLKGNAAGGNCTLHNDAPPIPGSANTAGTLNSCNLNA